MKQLQKTIMLLLVFVIVIGHRASAKQIRSLNEMLSNNSVVSNTNYAIYVDLKSRQQTLYILNKDNDKWVVIKQFKCAGGKPKTPTVTGEFTVGSKGRWFYSKRYRAGAKYYTQVSGSYLFH